MTYGETIRNIRISKGMSQKEIYTNILSKSYAIEFEKGKHQISAVLLLMILDQLSVGIEEFLYINNDYQLNEQAAYSEAYSKYSNAHDLAGLNQLLTDLEKNRGQVNEIHKAEVRTRVDILKEFEKTGVYRSSVANKQDVALIISYLTNIETWTLEEIKLYTNTIEFFDLTTHLLFFKKIELLFPLYRDYDVVREILCTLCINLIREALLTESLVFADQIIQKLLEYSMDYRQFLHHMYAKFYQYIYLYKKTNDPLMHTKAASLLELIEELDHRELAKELQEFLVELSD